MKYTKPPLTHAQQLDQLLERGMVCTHHAQALHCLDHLNYYRLGAYWLPFESSHSTHAFKPGTRLEDVLNLYVFDRELRLLVLDAIERVEVSVRTVGLHAGAPLWFTCPPGRQSVQKPRAQLGPQPAMPEA